MSEHKRWMISEAASYCAARMPPYCRGRSPRRAACLAASALAIAAIACPREEHRPIDAAIALDAPPPIDAPAPPDAAVTPAPTVTKLVASGDTTCAVMSDLTVRCWGGNSHGQLGNGTTADSATQVTPAIHAVKDLQLADATACALLDDGSVACWGRIAWHGHADDTLRPTGLLGVIGVTQIFVRSGRACARVADGSLICWGNVDARGHLATGAANRIPTPVVGVDHIAGLVDDGAFSDDGRMWHWLADGVPVQLDVAGVQDIAERDGTPCGRLQTGRVVCAASERCGLRHPAHTAPGKPTKPIKPNKLPARSNKPSKSAVATTARPSTDAADSAGPAGEPAETLEFSAVRQLAFGIDYCVVTTTNKLQCGNGCRRVDPVKLERVDHVVGRCVQYRAGTVACFDGRIATAPGGVSHPRLLAAGRAHACAVVDTRIVCWGSDDHHQLGELAVPR